MKGRLNVSTAVAALACLTACAGTVIVDYAIDATVQGVDAGGAAWEASREQIKVLPRSPALLSPFPAVQYEGHGLAWTFGTGTLGLGGGITNTGADRVCLRFDEATISSNLRTSMQPLTVSHWSVIRDRKLEALGDTRREHIRYFAPPSLCIEPMEKVSVSFAPDLRDLFPTRKMFNVRWPDDSPILSSKGVGNWVRVALPVERARGRGRLEFQLTALDSKARVSYY
jgi:hypothetical protein